MHRCDPPGVRLWVNRYEAQTMTDHERTTTRETSATDPGPNPVRSADAYGAPPAASSTVRTTERAYEPAGPSSAATVARIVTFAFGILQALLILRIILLVLVANPGNDIVSLILNVTNPFVEPFRGMFALDKATADRSIFDIAALVALIGWTLLEAVVLAGLRIFQRRPNETAQL